MMQKTDNLQKRYAVYSRIFAVGFLITAVTFLPYLADYYVLQPAETVLTFYRHNSVNIYYEFENWIVMLSVIVIWCISGSEGMAITIPSMLVLLLSYVDSIKYATLNELFRFGDLRLTEAAGIATRYISLKFTPAQIMAIVAILFLCAGAVISEKFCRKYPLFPKIKVSGEIVYALRIFCAFLCLAAMFFYGKQFIENEYSMEAIDNAAVTNTGNDRYVLYNFLKNDSLANIDMAHAENSYHFFLDNTATDGLKTGNRQYPNVIVIMNESWWNTDNISGDAVSFSSDPMEPYHRLAESCSYGELSANVHCGGTIGSETEFLTGLNLKYLNSFMGIASEMQEHKVPSIVDYFNALNYDTVAIHPYVGSFYGRDKIYPSLGFDKIIFEDSMSYTDIYSCYISDESLAMQIMKEYEENKGSQKFIFAVSVGNHISGMDSEHHPFIENYPYPISVTLDGSLEEEAYTDMINYINGIYLANEAFAQLVSYFEQQKEPTVLVMYGDHMPGFSEEVLTLFGLNGDDMESQRRQYAVPVLMWSNFETEKIVLDGENIGYLPQLLIEYAHLPESGMTRILKYQRELFKTNTGRITIDCYGQPIASYNEEQIEAIRHYKVVSFDMLNGSSPQRDRVWLPYE